MSTALAYAEPYRFPAGLLALVVHLAFFSLLYFGVHWQSHPPESFVVEMWDNLPDTEAAPERAPTPPAKMEPMPPRKVVSPVLPPVKADIEVRDKKNKKTDVKIKPDKKNQAKEKAAKQEAERKELEAYAMRNRTLDQQRVRDEQERVRNEVSTATQVQVERYQGLIRDKIKRKMKKLADVPDSAEAIFRVTLLPDGTLVDDPVMLKGSGYSAYDEAAARAILSAQPLPMPTDPTLQKLFREFKLSIKPKESE